MPFDRLPARDPRTVARDIPGVLDILFPRLTGGLVNTLNASMFSFSEINPIQMEMLDRSGLQKAMLFELSMARAESELRTGAVASWDEWSRRRASAAISMREFQKSLSRAISLSQIMRLAIW